MKTLYFDCFAGASGNMILGALVALGVDADALVAELGKLGIADFRIDFTTRDKSGISALHAEVVVPSEHVHRHLHHIEKIIDDAPFADSVKTRARAIFARLASAEAKIHGIDVGKVHFHEVGAMDAIVDIVGACIGFEMLGIERFACSRLHVGSGFAKMAHGTFPVPRRGGCRTACRSADLLDGNQWRTCHTDRRGDHRDGLRRVRPDSRDEGPENRVRRRNSRLQGLPERSSPDPRRKRRRRGVIFETGRSRDEPRRCDRRDPRICYGKGVRGRRPRLLVHADPDEEEPPGDDGVDPMRARRPRKILRAAGDGNADARRASTGDERICLDREKVTVATRFGDVPVKLARFEGKAVNAKPEFDVIRDIAKREGISLRDVDAEVRRILPD